MYSTFTFGLLFTISRRKTVDFSSIWSDPYGLNFGDFVDPDDNVDFTMDYIVFIGATLFNVVLMLNLLISILGDSYEKFQLKQVIIDYRERAEFVLDIQIMKNLTKFSMDQKYLHICKSSYQEEDESENWEGRIKYLDRKLDRIIHEQQESNKKTSSDKIQMRDNLEGIQKSLEKNIFDVQNNVLAVENIINSVENKISLVEYKISSLSETLEEILKLVKK